MTDDQAFDYLYTRAANEGITVTDLLNMTPDSVSDCNVESATFWKQVDYSHINPVSTHPDQAHDPLNAFLKNALLTAHVVQKLLHKKRLKPQRSTQKN